MRVIIIGGTGLIGQALAADLVKDDYEVIVLTRDPAKAMGLPTGVKAERWDAKTPQGWGHWLEGAEAVVNLAGAGIAGDGLIPTPWRDRRKKVLTESRVNAGIAASEAVRLAKVKPRLFVQASAVGYYPVHTDQQEITENTNAGTGFLPQLCQAWEKSSLEVEKQGVRRIILRTGLVLSPKGGMLPRTALPFRLFVGGPMGSGQQWMPWIHIADQIAAMRFLMGHDEAKGVFNICVPHPVRNREFGKTIGKVLGRPAFIPIPAFALQLALGEMATILLDGQRAIPQRLLEMQYKFRFTNLEEALRHLWQR